MGSIMLRKRFLIAAAVVGGSVLGLGGGPMAAPAGAVDMQTTGPVLGYCSGQTEWQKRLIGEFNTYGVACLDNSAGGPISPACLIYKDDMGGSGADTPWPA